MNPKEHKTEGLWRLSSSWRIEALNGEHLLAQAGADEVYLIDEAPQSELARILTLCESGDAALHADDPHIGAALRQLRRLGALVPAAASQPFDTRARLVWVGSRCDPLADGLRAQGWHLLEDSADAPLTLIVRTSGDWAALLNEAARWQAMGPHLLIDLSHHHTLSVGPLVVPGQTACLACLGHRIVHRWGDLPPPQEPKMLQRAGGVAAMLVDAVRLGPELVEQVATLDLRHLRMSRHRVHVQPGCPVCQATRLNPAIAPAQPFDLPWVH